MADDDAPQPGQLLDDLQRLSRLLHGAEPAEDDLPVLRDILPRPTTEKATAKEAPVPSFRLHNVHIDEGPGTEPVEEPVAAAAPELPPPLLEALVDDVLTACLPMLEEALRQQLSALSSDVLLQLLEPPEQD